MKLIDKRVNIWGEKGGTLSLIFIITSSFQSYFSLSECWCFVCMFTPYISELFVFHRKKLILLNLINWYVTSTSQWFLNSKDIAELCKVNFWYQKLYNECNTNCCEHKTVAVNIYLYEYFILLTSVCIACLCLFIWYWIRVPAKNHVIC